MYSVDLLDKGDETDTLARQASEHLESAATGALRRNDFSAAANLLDRAARLPPVPELRRAQLMAELVPPLIQVGRFSDAAGVIDEARSLAPEDDHVHARFRVERHFLELCRAETGATKGVSAVVARVLPILERADDQEGLCRAWDLQGTADFYLGGVSAAEAAWERGAHHAGRAGLKHLQAEMLASVAATMWTGARPADEGIRRCDEILGEVQGHLASEAEVLRPLAGLHGFAGRFDVARELFRKRNEALDELGRSMSLTPSITEAFVEMLAGDFAAAERCFRRGYDALEAMGENAVRSTTAALLARALFGQGRFDDAEQFTEVAEQLGEPDDALTQIVWRCVRARVAAVRGSFE
jgi:tetratricopeptide (TPR) repeat protein